MIDLVYQFSAGLVNSVRLMKPPRTDRARWMAYAINILLLWLLQDMVKLTPAELRGIKEMARYTVFVYFESWFRSPFITDAALLDLRTFKLLDEYAG